MASLPNVEGVLQQPKDFESIPRDLEATCSRVMAVENPAPTGWVHHSVDSSPERRAKAERLLDSVSEEYTFATPGRMDRGPCR